MTKFKLLILAVLFVAFLNGIWKGSQHSTPYMIVASITLVIGTALGFMFLTISERK